MSQSRKVVYYVAVTLDNFIAHPDGTVDGFLMEGHHATDYLESLRAYDTVLMGKNTYEFGYQYGMVAGEPVPTYGHMQQYVFSNHMPAFNHPQLQVIRGEAAEFVQALKQQTGGSIYLCGGGQLAGSLLDHGLIDEVIFKVYPVQFGAGIPAFGASQKPFTATLLDTKIYQNGVVFLHHSIH